MRSPLFLVAALMCVMPVLVLGQDAAPQIEPVTPWSNEQLSVEMIEHVLAVLHAESDRDLARELDGHHLTQRLTAARFERLNLKLPGKETRQALLAIADEAAFLDLPAADLLDLPVPGRAAQERMVSRATAFVATTISRMPDFIATRTTTRFQDAYVMRSIEKHFIAVEGFRFIDRHEVAAVYRDGQEVDQGLKATKPEKNINNKPGLRSWGEFGPLLGVVVADLLKGKISWSHWEQTDGGPAAVFQFAVEADKSSYIVRYCCVLKGGKSGEFTSTPAYHGEIALEPATGAVLRIVLKSDLSPDVVDLRRADLVVDYKRIDIGGRRYILPARSISLSKAPTAVAINDVVFDQYHQFRGEMRIVPSDGSDQSP
jgi:hypothetical protein